MTFYVASPSAVVSAPSDDEGYTPDSVVKVDIPDLLHHMSIFGVTFLAFDTISRKGRVHVKDTTVSWSPSGTSIDLPQAPSSALAEASDGLRSVIRTIPVFVRILDQHEEPQE